MIKLLITPNHLFDLQNINIEEYDEYYVPDDYLKSPLLSARFKDGVIYLEENENNTHISPYNLILGNEIPFEQLLQTADYYQMYNVPSFISILLLNESITYPLNTSNISDIVENMPKSIIIKILEFENTNFWKEQIYHRGKLNNDKLMDFKISEEYIHHLPTHPRCFYANPLIAWDNIKYKSDIKKLLYLTIEMDMNVNEQILEVATSFSDASCYPYDDDMIRMFQNRYSLNKVSMSSFKQYLNPVIMKLLDYGTSIHYSSYIDQILLQREIYITDYFINGSNFKNALNKLCEETLVTNISISDFFTRYDIYFMFDDEKRSLILYDCDGDTDYLNLEIYKEGGDIKISTDSKFLIYACTGIIPMDIKSFIDKSELDYKLNSGIPKSEYYNLYKHPFNLSFLDGPYPIDIPELNFNLMLTDEIVSDVMKEKFKKLFVDSDNLIEEKLYISNLKRTYNKNINDLENLNMGLYRFINLYSYSNDKNNIGILSSVDIISNNDIDNNMEDINDKFTFKEKIQSYSRIIISKCLESFIVDININKKVICCVYGRYICFDNIYTRN